MGSLRVGFLSGVRHADSYLSWFRAAPQVRVVGVGDDDSAREWVRSDGQEVARRHSVRWLGDPSSWLNPDEVDLVVVCSEPTRHAALARLSIERGVRVLIDKPVATDLASARQVVAAAAAHDVHTSVINRTFAPALRRARDWVDSGYLGLPRHLDMEFFASGAHFDTSVERPELVVDRDLSGGGELLNFLGYCIDAIRFVAGLKVRSVMAMADSLFMRTHREAGVEDAAVLLLQLDKGVSASVTLGRLAQAPGTGPTTSSLRVLGSHGHAVADDDRPGVTVFGTDGTVRSLGTDGGQRALEGYLEHVVQRSLRGLATEYTAADACETVAVIEAAYRSIDDGEPAEPGSV